MISMILNNDSSSELGFGSIWEASIFSIMITEENCLAICCIWLLTLPVLLCWLLFSLPTLKRYPLQEHSREDRRGSRVANNFFFFFFCRGVPVAGRHSRKTLKILHPSAWNPWTGRGIIPVAVLSYVAHLTQKRGDDSDGANLVTCSVSQFFPLFATLCTEPAKLQCPWAFLNKNTSMGCHFLLQGIFLTFCVSYMAGRFCESNHRCP